MTKLTLAKRNIEINKIDVTEVTRWLHGALEMLANEEQKINKINVFPIPDSDTGTNAFLSFKAAFAKINNNKYKTVGELLTGFSNALILSAQGNSGVIISQIFYGMALALERSYELTIPNFINSLVAGSHAAAKAVNDPKKGTILTVMHTVAKQLYHAQAKILDWTTLFAFLTQKAHAALEDTIKQLALLKSANVVDAGAFALCCIFDGFQNAYLGKNISLNPTAKQRLTRVIVRKIELNPNHDKLFINKYGYCNEVVMILREKSSIQEVKTLEQLLLNQHCNSLVTYVNFPLLKAHYHSKTPGVVLALLNLYGEFQHIKISNMNAQVVHDQPKQFIKLNFSCIIPICVGHDMANYFKTHLNIPNVITSLPHVRPSVHEILTAAEAAACQHVFIAPNDENIFLTITKAASLAKNKVFQIHLIPTNNIGEGYLSCLWFDHHEKKPNSVINFIQSQINRAQVYSISQSLLAQSKLEINGLKILEHDYLFVNKQKKVIASASSITELFLQAIAIIGKEQKTTNFEIVTLFYNPIMVKQQLPAIKQILIKHWEVEIRLIPSKTQVLPIILVIE